MSSYLFGGENLDEDVKDDIIEIFRERTGEKPSTYDSEDVFFVSPHRNIDQGRVKIAFNGYLTDCDKTPEEYIASKFEEHGKDVFKQLNGQFRAIIWDKKKETFHVASGKAGRKVVYYTKTEDFAVSSHITPLLRHPEIEPEISPVGLSYFLQSWSASFAGGERLIKHIYRLFPSHQLMYSNGNMSETKYWEVYNNKKNVSDSEAVDKLDELLTEGAEKLVDQTEGPLNVLLSGGFDSTFLIALLREVTDKEINTYTWGWKDEHLEKGREMAELYGTNHTEIKNEYNFPTDEELMFYEEPQNLFVRYPYPDLYHKHGVRSFWTGLNSQATFPVCLEDVRKLDQLSKFEPLLKRTPTKKLKQQTASQIDYKAAKAIEVLESENHSTAAVIDWNLLPEDSNKLLSKELQSKSMHLEDFLDEKWDLSNKSYQENYNYLQLRSRDTARYAYYAQNFEHYDVYGYIPLIEYSYSLPMSQKKNRRLLQKIASGRVPDRIINEGASGWSFVNDQLRKTLKNNEKDYRQKVDHFIERGYVNKEYARKILLPDEIKPRGGGRGIISQMIAVYLLERWIQIFVDREEPWKPV